MDLLVVDYVGLVTPQDSKAPRQEQVASISRRLKALARDLRVPIVCLAQLNRLADSGGDSRPKLSHLRESGSLEQDADVVLFLYRPAYYDKTKSRDSSKPEKAEIIVAKNRNGPVGSVDVMWFDSIGRFENASNGMEWQPYKE